MFLERQAFDFEVSSANFATRRTAVSQNDVTACVLLFKVKEQTVRDWFVGYTSLGNCFARADNSKTFRENILDKLNTRDAIRATMALLCLDGIQQESSFSGAEKSRTVVAGHISTAASVAHQIIGGQFDRFIEIAFTNIQLSQNAKGQWCITYFWKVVGNLDDTNPLKKLTEIEELEYDDDGEEN